MSAMLLVGGLGLTLASGSPATAATRPAAVHGARIQATSFNGTCQVWTDGNTFGSDCSNVGGNSYLAVGFCKNGQIAYGPFKTSGWSYAYCSTYDSQLNEAETQIIGSGSTLVAGQGPLRPAILRAHLAQESLAASRTRQGRPLNRAKAPAIAASGSGHCSVWTDGTTFGGSCVPPTAVFEAYGAVATCTNGWGASGPVVSSGWSYAYCSTHGQKATAGAILF
jgi:hypothetical protein